MKTRMFDLPLLFTAELPKAFQAPGCPICTLRDQVEERYLYSLLWEGINDGDSRKAFIDSLGFCSKHTWQAGQMEVQGFHDGLGNSQLYSHLALEVSQRLSSFLERIDITPENRVKRWWSNLTEGKEKIYFPHEIETNATCRVCEIAADSEKNDLLWLLKALTENGSKWRAQYQESGRLCFCHLRQALEVTDPAVREAVIFLARDARNRLSQLSRDLDSYAGKHAWDRREEEMTESERNSWLEALRIFGGNPDKNIPDLMDR